MTYLVSTLIDEVREELYGTFGAEWNVVNGAQTNVDTTIEFSDSMEGIGLGSVLQVGDELMYVRAVNIAGLNATVIRGFRGTTAVAITAGATLEVNPRFPINRIRRAVRDEVDSWPASLYSVVSEAIVAAAGDRAFSLSRADAFRALDVRRDPSSTSRSTLPRVAKPWDIVRAAGPGAGGFLLQIGDTAVPAGNVYVTYACPFDTSSMVDAIDLEDDVGLSRSMVDIVRWGVMWRVTWREEIDRVDLGVQGQARKAQEVQAGEVSSFSGRCKGFRDARISDEADRLRALYGGV